MNIILKNIKHVESLSEETFCFSASLYVDGKKAGTVANRGHGGSHEFSDWNVAIAINEFAKTLPTRTADLGNGKSWEVDADIIVSDLVSAFLIEKDLKRALKSRILFTKKGTAGLFETNRLSQAMQERARTNPKILGKIDPTCILNFMRFEDALKIYKTHSA